MTLALSAWNSGADIAARFELALHGLSALDLLVRQSIHSVSHTTLQNPLHGLHGMSSLEWEVERRSQEEYEERAAVMQLYAAFEGLLRRDAEWRGLQPTACFHQQFSSMAQKVRKGKFVRLSEWLNCWQATRAVQVAVLNQLETTFRQDRNPLMHTNQVIVPPLLRVRQQLINAYSNLSQVADDFGTCDE
ncbi:hypothetical protein [Aquaspirillum serpens]|uniref:hypothetical protein n=1 Tax=Aquaspirillum serpens TaxID=190 RepID=UPI0003B3F3E4|nr:hypothetical protein [Aquaspirillum serpens]